MIRIERGLSNPIPPSIQQRASVVLAEYYSSSSVSQRQSRAPLDKLWPEVARLVNRALDEIFHGKCAYCESSWDSMAMNIDQFRPVVASDVDGGGSLAHYQWLRLEWGNLYPCCAPCNRAKRGLFPVEGTRAPIHTPVDRIHLAEHSLLIDPCLDDPEKHLKFLSGGIVHGLTPKGEMTINVFNLNRESLVRDRKNVWDNIKSMLGAGFVDTSFRLPHERYSAVAKAAFEDRPGWSASMPHERPRRFGSDEILAGDQDTYRLAQRPLKRVRVRNFKMIRDLEVELPGAVGEKAPWLVLLGENASGKSTLLQAIALALAGASEASRLLMPSRVLSHGADSGEVELEFWDIEEVTRLVFQRGAATFHGTNRPSATVRAFGALRHMERRSRRMSTTSGDYARIEDLTRPIARIEYPGRWLLGLTDERFDAAARVLKELLPLAADMTLIRSGNRVIFKHGGAFLPLTLASSGYQTVIGMAAEVMKMLFTFWETLESATAIVLVDELDAHLHPQWKMRIVTALRTAFPNVQFIASTHDPLLLRGLRDGEVALMRRAPDATATLDQKLPPIEGMQVDEILTSKAFGLDTTLDPETEDLFDEYYHLLSIPMTDGVGERIAELRSRLGDREALGRNARENAMLKASAQFIAERRAAASGDIIGIGEEGLKNLRDMFSDVPDILGS